MAAIWYSRPRLLYDIVVRFYKIKFEIQNLKMLFPSVGGCKIRNSELIKHVISKRRRLYEYVKQERKLTSARRKHDRD